MGLDRFSQGGQDPADRKYVQDDSPGYALTHCASCGKEFFYSDLVWVVENVILCQDATCLVDFIQPDIVAVETAIKQI